MPEKISFINPANDGDTDGSANNLAYPNLGLLEIATNVRNSLNKDLGQEAVQVEVIDMNVGQCSTPGELERVINESTAIGLSIIGPNAWNGLKIAKQAAEAGKLVLLGNDHATYRAAQVLKQFSDSERVVVVKGDDAHSQINEIIRRTLTGRHTTDFSDLPSVVYKDTKGKIRGGTSLIGRAGNPTLLKPTKHENQEPYNKDWADRSLIDSTIKQKYFEAYRNHMGRFHPTQPEGISGDEIRQTTLNIAQGCERVLGELCTFCGIYDLRFRNTTADKAIAEVSELYNTHGYNYFYLVADDFFSFVVPGRGNFFIELGTQWPFGKEIEIYCYAQAHNIIKVAKTFPDRFELLRKMNVTRFNVGFESGSSKMLHNLQKGAYKELNRQAAEIAAANKITMHTSFVLGGMGESEETLAETFGFIRDLIELSKRDDIPNNIAAIEPATMYPAFGTTAWRIMTDLELCRRKLAFCGLKEPPDLERRVKKYQEIEHEAYAIEDDEQLVRGWCELFCKVPYERIQDYVRKITELSGNAGIFNGSHRSSDPARPIKYL